MVILCFGVEDRVAVALEFLLSVKVKQELIDLGEKVIFLY